MVSCRFRVSSFLHPWIVGLLFGCLIIGCAAQGGRHIFAGSDPCTALDSLYESSGFESPVAMTGKITFDVEQYRIRGQFALNAKPDGEIGFEFSNSALFGQQHEDLSMSVSNGIVRILDRERGRYYEGREVDELLDEMVGLEINTGEILSLALGEPPPCADLQDRSIGLTRNGEAVFRSRTRGEDIRIEFDGERRAIRSFEWPLSLAGGRITRMRVEYSWERREDGIRVLQRLVLSVPDKGWRIKLVAVN